MIASSHFACEIALLMIIYTPNDFKEFYVKRWARLSWVSEWPTLRYWNKKLSLDSSDSSRLPGLTYVITLLKALPGFFAELLNWRPLVAVNRWQCSASTIHISRFGYPCSYPERSKVWLTVSNYQTCTSRWKMTQKSVYLTITASPFICITILALCPL